MQLTKDKEFRKPKKKNTHWLIVLGTMFIPLMVLFTGDMSIKGRVLLSITLGLFLFFLIFFPSFGREEEKNHC
jgi:hypothetical protein